MGGFAAQYLLHGLSFCRVVGICLVWVLGFCGRKDRVKFNGIWAIAIHGIAWANALEHQRGYRICRVYPIFG